VAIARRSAETTWEGTLAAGHGSVSSESGALDGLDVTWAARTQAPEGKTSPEELAAAAHSACFAMALSLRLGEHQVRSERLQIGATVTLDERDGVPTIVSSALQVSVRAPDLDDARLHEIVQEAAALCPVSRLFTGAEISVHAELG
jgi:osmotically inducible protein OsmC